MNTLAPLSSCLPGLSRWSGWFPWLTGIAPIGGGSEIAVEKSGVTGKIAPAEEKMGSARNVVLMRVPALKIVIRLVVLPMRVTQTEALNDGGTVADIIELSRVW